MRVNRALFFVVLGEEEKSYWTKVREQKNQKFKGKGGYKGKTTTKSLGTRSVNSLSTTNFKAISPNGLNSKPNFVMYVVNSPGDN